MVTFAQIKTFLWLARLGSASAVADHLNLTQPAVSSRLANLQDALDVQLFVRTQTGLSLTSAGLRLKAHAEQLEARLGMLEADLIPQTAVSRLLRIGVAETIAQTWLADFVHAVAERRPQVSLELLVDSTDSLREQLLARSVDLAVLMGPVSNSEVSNTPVPSFPMAWYRRADWTEADAQNAAIVTFNVNTKPFKQMWARVLRGEESRKFIPSASLSAGFELVSRGVGIGALPQIYADAEIADRGLVEFDGGALPDPPHFTISHLYEPLDEVVNEITALGQQIAQSYDRNAVR